MAVFTLTKILLISFSFYNIMFLEKLEIQGFKSFANKNKLIFSGLINDQKRGLTAIVGPNGSGKSNIADAVRWALGEQSLKTLRGKKSEDVIFSGSDKKNQLSLAEVSLFLNNQDRSLFKNIKSTEKDVSEKNNLDQILLTNPEIIITRRVYRSGESEYLLNGNRVRLSDIQMLLAKANFGQKTYSVIGQGMVENFLNSSAAERKDFFDEATGVKQFQIKRDAALNKLESSYENLQQIDLLLSEIKPRLKSLTRQVDKLKKRDELEKELRLNQLNYYGFLWQNINQKLNHLNSQYLALEKTKLEKEKKLEKLNDELNKIRATDNFREINELQPRLRDLENQKSQQIKKLTKLQAELETEWETRGNFDISWLNNKADELKNDLETLTLNITSLENSRPKNENQALSDQLQEIIKEINEAKSIKEHLIILEKERFELEQKFTKLEITLETKLEAKNELDLTSLQIKQKNILEELKTLNQSQEEYKNANNNNKQQELSKKIQSLQSETNQLNLELNKITEKIKIAAKSGGKNQEINNLVANFLKDLDQISSITDLNEIKKLIKTAKETFETKIKELLTGESDEDSRRIQYLQNQIINLAEKKQSLSNQLNQESLRLSEIREKLSVSTNKINQLQEELLVINKNIEKVQDDFDAKKIEEEQNKIKRRQNEINQEINKLEANNKLPTLEDKRTLILEKIQNCRLQDSAITERINLLTEKKEQTKQELNGINEKLEKNKNKINASEMQIEKESIEVIINSLNQEIEKIRTSLEKLNKAKEEEKNLMFSCQKDIQNLQEHTSALTNELNNIKIEATRQETRLEDLENNIRNDELDIKEIRHYQTNGSEADLSNWQKIINNHKNQLEQIGGIDPETEKEHEDTKNRFDFLNNQTNDLNQAIKSLEQIIYELDLNIKDRFDREFKLISEKFNEYFQILFNGGTAKMSKIMLEDLEKEENKKEIDKLENTSHLAEAELELQQKAEEKFKKLKLLKKYNAVGLAGIEIQATPPGKKIQSVTMLSGGERALTAIALICAIISANPSPFVVLDEVDAALDESNSERLAKILDDLSNKTQFIIITHNRASMRKASILYGVTMQTDGVSQIISVKLDEINIQPDEVLLNKK